MIDGQFSCRSAFHRHRIASVHHGHDVAARSDCFTLQGVCNLPPLVGAEACACQEGHEIQEALSL